MAVSLRKRLVPAELHHHEVRDDGRYQLSLSVSVGEMALRQIGQPLDLTTSASGKIHIVFNDPKLFARSNACRFPLQQSLQAWRRGCRARRARAEGH
jgi:hypothetical protein